MAEKTGCVRCLFEVVLQQVILQAFVGEEPRLFKPIHALANLNVDVPILS